MTSPYCCPNCKTNKSRFNIIKQVPQSVKMDPHSGMILEEYTSENLSPFHIAYQGPDYKIQCGSCGLVEDERTFIKFGEKNKIEMR